MTSAYRDSYAMACEGAAVGICPIARSDGRGTTLFTAAFVPQSWMALHPPEVVALITLANTRRSAKEAGCHLV